MSGVAPALGIDPSHHPQIVMCVGKTNLPIVGEYALVYLDAFVPESGKFTSDYYFSGHRREAVLKTLIDGWLVPPQPIPDDTSPADVLWAAPRRVPQPLQSVAR